MAKLKYSPEAKAEKLKEVQVKAEAEKAEKEKQKAEKEQAKKNKKEAEEKAKADAKAEKERHKEAVKSGEEEPTTGEKVLGELSQIGKGMINPVDMGKNIVRWGKNAYNKLDEVANNAGTDTTLLDKTDKATFLGLEDESTDNVKEGGKGGYWAQNLAQTQKDINALSDIMKTAQGEVMKNTSEFTDKEIADMKEILDKAEKSDLSYSVKDLPMGIIRRAKRGDFGKFNIDEDVKKAYMAEMKKPVKERDQKVIDAYNKEKESTKDAKNIMGNFIINALFTGLANAGNALQGKASTEKSAFQKYSESKLQGAMDRYNKLWQDASENMQQTISAKGFKDRETMAQIQDLYKNAQFRPYLDKLDTDSMERTILLAKRIGGKVDLSTFKDALMLQLLNDPKGALAGALQTSVSLIPGGGIVSGAVGK